MAKRQLFCLDCVEQWKKVFDTYPGEQNSFSKNRPRVPTYVDPAQISLIRLGCQYRDNGCQSLRLEVSTNHM